MELCDVSLGHRTPNSNFTQTHCEPNFRCIKKLQECNGDVGVALEELLSDFLQIDPDNEDRESEDNSAEQEMRNDEKMALESIYADAFRERVPGRVWEIKLELSVMRQYLRKEEKPSQRNKAATDEKNVCRFFLRGHCKFGKRCRQKHINPDKQQVCGRYVLIKS